MEDKVVRVSGRASEVGEDRHGAGVGWRCVFLGYIYEYLD